MQLQSTRPVHVVAFSPPQVTPPTMCSPSSSPQTSLRATGSTGESPHCASSMTKLYTIRQPVHLELVNAQVNVMYVVVCVSFSVSRIINYCVEYQYHCQQ